MAEKWKFYNQRFNFLVLAFADNLVQVGFFFTDLLICHYPMFINHSRFAKILLQTSTISDVVQYMF